ncbi:hypothetical protein FACS1894211_02530 [Clostridia bacterium]|nr:hypothetical protein FACS1894211_02530 [Clostridia bacterium]
MENKITLKGQELYIVGREFIAAKAASTFNNKSYPARPDSYVLYLCLGDKDKAGFFDREPKILSASLPRADYEKYVSPKNVKADVVMTTRAFGSDIRNYYDVVSVDGVAVVPKVS